MAETELRKICDGIHAFMTEDVVPSTSIRESKVVHYKVSFTPLPAARRSQKGTPEGLYINTRIIAATE